MSNPPFNYRKQRLPQMEAGVFCRNLSYLKSAQESIALMKVSGKVCEKVPFDRIFFCRKIWYDRKRRKRGAL
ncbi:hypothetical protein EY675_11920 [Enterococcus casseliflavus]|nr:hypothetical protein [Enterococcus casseliflavus]